MKKINVLLLFCLTLLIAACSREPAINPHPNYFVTISGHIDQDMKKPVYLAFWATYAGYKTDCKVWVNYFEGVPGMKGKIDFYTAKPDTKGDYVVKIPIDRYLPGKCDWKVSRMEYSSGNAPIPKSMDDANRLGTLMSFGRKDSPNELPGLPRLHGQMHNCNNGDNFCTGHPLMAFYTDVVERNKNYHFTYNFTK